MEETYEINSGMTIQDGNSHLFLDGEKC